MRKNVKSLRRRCFAISGEMSLHESNTVAFSFFNHPDFLGMQGAHELSVEFVPH